MTSSKDLNGAEMIISVRITPNAKKPEITKLDGGSYKIKVDAPATDGKANARLIKILSDYFKVSKSSVSIVKGHRSREKVLEVLV